MPYLGIHISKKLSEETQDRIKREIGQVINLIPNKREEVLMIEFLKGEAMYLGGVKSEDIAYIDLKCYKKAPYEENKAFTEQVYRILKETLGLESGQVYLTIAEYDNWGSKGTLK